VVLCRDSRTGAQKIWRSVPAALALSALSLNFGIRLFKICNARWQRFRLSCDQFNLRHRHHRLGWDNILPALFINCFLCHSYEVFVVDLFHLVRVWSKSLHQLVPFRLIHNNREVMIEVYHFPNSPSWLGWGARFPVRYICSVAHILPVSGHQRKWLTFVCVVARLHLTVCYSYKRLHLGALKDGN
jgi:hypothetical protein